MMPMGAIKIFMIHNHPYRNGISEYLFKTTHGEMTIENSYPATLLISLLLQFLAVRFHWLVCRSSSLPCDFLNHLFCEIGNQLYL